MAQCGFRTGPERSATTTQGRKAIQTRSFRGSKSRNKVSVGEPAEGSLQSCKTPLKPSRTQPLNSCFGGAPKALSGRSGPPGTPQTLVFNKMASLSYCTLISQNFQQ